MRRFPFGPLALILELAGVSSFTGCIDLVYFDFADDLSAVVIDIKNCLEVLAVAVNIEGVQAKDFRTVDVVLNPVDESKNQGDFMEAKVGLSSCDDGASPKAFGEVTGVLV